MSDARIDRVDAALGDFLAWQASDRSGAPTATEMAARVAARTSSHARRPHPVWAFGLAAVLASLAILGAIVAGGRLAAPVRPFPAENGDILLPRSIQTVDSGTGAAGTILGCTGCDVQDAAWSPDGSALAFVDAFRRLLVWRPGTTTPAVLFDCPSSSCEAHGPAWSPDGGSIVFASGGQPSVIDVATRTVRQLPKPEGVTSIRDATWLRTGQIAYIAITGDEPPSAWVADADGTNASMLSAIPALAAPVADAAISPDGSRMAVVEDPSTGAPPAGFTIRLWVMAADGASRRLLYERPGCCLSLPIGQAAWSPDGTRIAFVGLSTPDGVGRADDVVLMTFDAATGDKTILGQAQLVDDRPAWRPAVPGS